MLDADSSLIALYQSFSYLTFFVDLRNPVWLRTDISAIEQEVKWSSLQYGMQPVVTDNDEM